MLWKCCGHTISLFILTIHFIIHLQQRFYIFFTVSLKYYFFFIFITQFSDFWVMSYGNWKHILSIFSFQNSVSNDIFVIKHTLKDSRSEQQPQHLTFFFPLGSVNFPFTLASSSFSFLFSHNLFSNTQTQTHKHFHPHKPTK